MDATRIEVLKNGVYIPLKLKTNEEIKYNALVNRIGKISERKISHTNTFQLPYISQNISALDINVFNLLNLSNRLNTKYVAKYYINEKIFRTGFLVINNSRGSDGIMVNFIDEGLDLVGKWGSISYIDFLKNTNENLTHPADYQVALDQMESFQVSKTSKVDSLSNVGTRGFPIALYPNNLNTVGDKFQTFSDDNRNNIWNPYQSRPIFNVKALFDLAIETYGYTANYTTGVNWANLEQTYMVAKGLNNSLKNETSLITKTYPSGSGSYHGVIPRPNGNSDVQAALDFGAGKSLKPNNITGWDNPSVRDGYEDEDCVFQPITDIDTSGEITVFSNIVGTPDAPSGFIIQLAWHNASQNAVVFKDITSSVTHNPLSGYDVEFEFSKSLIDTPPTLGVHFLGLLVILELDNIPDVGGIGNEVTTSFITESYTTGTQIAFDKNQEYINTAVPMTFGAPRSSVKELISSIMQKEGLLMRIDSVNKVVKLFNYGHYQTMKEDGTYTDLSKFYMENYIPTRSTDYGEDYGVNNKVGLTSPYLGNEYNIELSNNDGNSKYKESANNHVKKFKDITNLLLVDNTVKEDYYEFTVSGQSLVEHEGNIPSMPQQNFEKTLPGADLLIIPKIVNVNYAEIPAGIRQWYNLVDRGVRVEGVFIIPEEEMKNLDLSIPAYIEGLGGFYIIEEVAGYTDGSNPVKIKLIKLIDNLK